MGRAHDEAELHRGTEGWPGGLYLAALYLKEGGPFADAAVSFSGDDRLVSEYLESEFLARISRQHRTFLTRTAVLERMCGPLCDAVLGTSGSMAALAGLERSNLLLVPLDRRGQWYRYHHLFRDMLLAELHRQEPDQIPILQRRAAQWYERNREPEEALEYWMKAGEVDSVARLAGALTFPAYQRGRVATVERWLGWLEDRAAMESYPAIAVLAALFCALTGEPTYAELWADVAHRGPVVTRLPDGSSSVEPWLALIRALLCRDGVERMRADAEVAARAMAPGSFWREADEILVRRPGLGVFARQAADLRAELSRARGSSALGASALTAAELRLLPMLSTHLSFPEIAEEMFLSRHTVKAEAMAIYRKLGVSSRNQAIGRARELALLDK